MNITIITPWLPYPLTSGGAQAQYNFIDTLRKEHHIAIIFPLNGKNRIEAMRHLQEIWPEVSFHPYSYFRQMTHGAFLKDKIVRAIKLKVCPNSDRFLVERALKPYGFYFTKDYMAFVNSVIKAHNTDLIQVEFYQYQHIVRFLPKQIRKVFVQHEIRYVRNRRLLASIKLTPKEEALFEQVTQDDIDDLNTYDQIISLTETDKEVMLLDGVVTPIAVSPAAVNTKVLPYQEWKGTVTFVGGYSHIPNQEGMAWFIKEVLPLVKVDELKAINVVGSGWPQHYQQIHPKLHFMGFVDDMQAVLQGSIVMVPILTGSGMRMKILDAAATCTPIVTTTVGVEGLNFQHQASCLIADTPADFANAINNLIAHANQRKALATQAQAVFQEQYSVAALSKVRNNIYLNETT